MITRFARFVCTLALLSSFTAITVAARAGGLTLSPRTGLDAFAALADQELANDRDELRIIAATENAASGDWDRLKAPMAQFARATPTHAAIWFAQPDGSYFTLDTGLRNENLKDRGYFPRLLAGEEVLGDLVVSKATGIRSTIIAVPLQKDGQVIGALGVSIAMERIADMVEKDIAFPPHVMFYALSGDGQIALHRESKMLFEFAGELGGQSLKTAIKEMLSKPEGTARYEFEGTEREAVFKKSNLTGWVYALRW